MNAPTVYVVDDEESVRHSLSIGLRKEYRVRAFSAAEEALAALETDPPAVVLLDVALPGMDGLAALREMRSRSPEVPVIMVTGAEDLETVVSAMRLGAHDYYLKPIYLDRIQTRIRNALNSLRMREEIQSLQRNRILEDFPYVVGESNAIQEVMELVGKIAKSPDAPVMILGETGTGKELIAKAVHYKGPNYKGPFVAVNCAAIPKELLESELFGYEKGAFSGAAAGGKRGLVEKAEGGTLLLDEVGELSLEAQAKFLRFLEEGEYYKVGGTRKIQARLRVVSATNRDLEDLTDRGAFRRDLFYRLSVVKVQLPSLNERRDDIVPLAIHFLGELGRKYGKPFRGFAPEALEVLRTRQWKGNIRELRNLVERGVLVADGNRELLTLGDLGLGARSAGAAGFGMESTSPFCALPEQGLDLPALEEHFLREAVKRTGGNEAKAARLLGMTYYAFRYRVKKLAPR